MSSAVFDRIRTAAADLLDVAPDRIGPETCPQDLEAWDSVMHLNLVLALEQQFEIEFSPEEIEGMKSVGAIAEIVEEKTGGR